MNIWSTLSGRKEIENSSCSLHLYGAYEYQCTELKPNTFKSIKDYNEEKHSLCPSFQSNKTFVQFQQLLHTDPDDSIINLPSKKYAAAHKATSF